MSFRLKWFLFSARKLGRKRLRRFPSRLKIGENSQSMSKPSYLYSDSLLLIFPLVYYSIDAESVTVWREYRHEFELVVQKLWYKFKTNSWQKRRLLFSTAMFFASLSILLEVYPRKIAWPPSPHFQCQI